MTRTYVQNRAGSNDIVVHRGWTNVELAEARRLRRDAGLSAAAIARKLKRTRNSVIGALWRAEEPRVRNDQHDRPVPLRFSEQRRVP